MGLCMFDQYCVVPVHAGSDWGAAGHDPTHHQVPEAAPLWPLPAAGKRPTTLPWAHVACETLSQELTQWRKRWQDFWSRRVSKLLIEHWGHMFSRFISKDYYNKAFVLCDKLTASSFAVCYFISDDRRVKGSWPVWTLQWRLCQHC